MKSLIYEDWYKIEIPAAASGADNSCTLAPELSGHVVLLRLIKGTMDKTVTYQADLHESRAGGLSTFRRNIQLDRRRQVQDAYEQTQSRSEIAVCAYRVWL